MLPNFLLIGAPRSGTTWIDDHLRLHPEVFMAPIKEVHFFDRHYERGLEFYESWFAGADGHKAVGECTPNYLAGQYCEHDVPALIRKHLPDVRLIACLRNPVDRAYSRYWNSKAKFDRNAGVSFEQKIEEKPEFIREGFYAQHLNRYYSLFPRERMLTLLYDDLVADPQGFMRRIYDFVGVDGAFASRTRSVRANAAAGKRNLARSRALWYASRALHKLHLARAAEGLRRINSIPIPPMQAETRRRLVALYREQNEELQQLIGRDLSHWNAVDESDVAARM